MKVLLVGATGRMGQEISSMVTNLNDVQIVAGIGHGISKFDFPIYTELPDVLESYECIIDFSSEEVFPSLYEFLLENPCPAVLCSTNYSEEQEALVENLATIIPIFRSANMSIGVYVLGEAIRLASQALGSRFDVSIIEKHHRYKKDNPSGTALSLEKIISSQAPVSIHGIRGGGIAGDHEVLFMSDEEVLSFSHHAENRSVFAKGAIEAAKFLLKQKPGYYTMKHLVK